MKLNSLAPGAGSKTSKKRLGRGIGSGLGKTSGKGHKGQKARAGGGIMPGFEGGQMPLQRRLPKFGFTSRKALESSQVRLSELNAIDGDVVSLESLKAAGLVRKDKRFVRIMASGTVGRAFTVKGVVLTGGAKAAIEAAGGKVEA